MTSGQQRVLAAWEREARRVVSVRDMRLEVQLIKAARAQGDRTNEAGHIRVLRHAAEVLRCEDWEEK